MKRSIALLVLSALVVGCASSKKPDNQPNYQTVGKDPRRDTDTAKAENARGLAALDKGNLTEAEAALKRALAADIMFGPAHNNLGKVYYKQNKLYLAAWEFEYAAKLMPHQAEPKNNMGLVFEAAGKWNEAIDNYSQALMIEPDNAEVIGNAARAHIRRGDSGPEVRELLTKLVMLDTRPQWVTWAKRRLIMIPETPIPTTPGPTTQPK
jgi:Tfp pilus assembly protein PilF